MDENNQTGNKNSYKWITYLAEIIWKFWMILILSNIIKLKPQIQTHNYKQKVLIPDRTS